MKYYKIAFWSTITGGILMYLLMIRVGYVWSDEAYTFALIKHSFSDICVITAADVHPPLYYILLKAFILPFDYSLLAAKLFSIVPFVLILIIGGIQMRMLFNEKMSLVFMVLFLLSPFLLKYAVEIRMYSLASLFVFINAIYAYRCYKKILIKIGVFLY